MLVLRTSYQETTSSLQPSISLNLFAKGYSNGTIFEDHHISTIPAHYLIRIYLAFVWKCAYCGV